MRIAVHHTDTRLNLTDGCFFQFASIYRLIICVRTRTRETKRCTFTSCLHTNRRRHRMHTHNERRWTRMREKRMKMHCTCGQLKSVLLIGCLCQADGSVWWIYCIWSGTKLQVCPKKCHFVSYRFDQILLLLCFFFPLDRTMMCNCCALERIRSVSILHVLRPMTSPWFKYLAAHCRKR